jgi:uncharacterized protein YjaZ
MKSIKREDFEIYSFLDNLKGNNAKKIINEIRNEVPFIKNIEYTGVDKELLNETLERFILDYNEDNQFFEITKKEQKKMLKISKGTLEELKKFSKSKKYLFIFPCFNKFTIESMNGLGGFCSSKNVILIFLNKNGKNWKRYLKETIYHEFAHSVSNFYKGGEFSIGDGLIFEGLAEHFRENIIGGEHAPYSKALSIDEIKKYLNKLKPKLNSMDLDLYMEVFFGVGEYPNWTGYSIGYYLIEKYLKEKKEVNWNKLLRENPKEILNKLKNNV